MRFITFLNNVEKFKSFTYSSVEFDETSKPKVMRISITPRKNSKPVCSKCGCVGPQYDRSGTPRLFEHVPLWGVLVFYVYRMRRVDCPGCGVTVEEVPWCEGKHRQTKTYRWFLARWAKRLSWTEVARIFHTSWDSVYRAVETAVNWGLAARDLSGITAIGVDEVAWQKGHKYLTLVYDISGSAKRLLAICEERTTASLRTCLESLGQEVCSQIRFVCSDMWRPYLKVIRAVLGNSVHILDRFHVMKKFGDALDEIRRDETRQLKQDGYEPVLTKSRWCLLKRTENLTPTQTVRLAELLKYNLRSVRAYLIREDFQRFWDYVSPTWAGKFLDEWTTRVMRSRLEPMKKVVRTIRSHRELILNWFRAKGTISAGAVEGLNNKVKLVTRKSYGFRSLKITKLALFHNLGNLPEPEFTHEFC